MRRPLTLYIWLIEKSFLFPTQKYVLIVDVALLLTEEEKVEDTLIAQ